MVEFQLHPPRANRYRGPTASSLVDQSTFQCSFYPHLKDLPTFCAPCLSGHLALSWGASFDLLQKSQSWVFWKKEEVAGAWEWALAHVAFAPML